MHRRDVQDLIAGIEEVDGAQRYLFGQPAHYVFAGLGASPTSIPGEYELFVMLDSWTAEAVEASDLLRQQADGQVRIQMTGRFTLDAAPTSQPRRQPNALSAGDSIGPAGWDVTGTLGFFARLSNDEVALVSNAHVLNPDHGGNLGAAISAPGHLDGDPNIVANVSVAHPIPGGATVVDAAAATLIDSVDFSTLLGSGHLNPHPLEVHDDMIRDGIEGAVSKNGRTTGLTHGVIHAVDGHLYGVVYGSTSVTLTDMILIAGRDGAPFTEVGDSGALVYSPATNQPVGLHVASARAGEIRLSGCHPIATVLDELDVTLATATSDDI